MMFERLLVIGVDFNALDAERWVRASLRHAASAEVPFVGERVLLTDAEGNSCSAVVESIDGLSILAKPEWETWGSGQVILVHAGTATTGVRSSIAPSADHPPTGPRGVHSGELLPA